VTTALSDLRTGLMSMVGELEASYFNSSHLRHGLDAASTLLRNDDAPSPLLLRADRPLPSGSQTEGLMAHGGTGMLHRTLGSGASSVQHWQGGGAGLPRPQQAGREVKELVALALELAGPGTYPGGALVAHPAPASAHAHPPA
jgi:hypothetical protein